MEPTPEKLRVLEALVEELLKEHPAENIISNRMREAGIEDTRDPIDRINKVLMALHFEDPEKEIQE